MVLATIPVEGQPRKVILHADRNGFFYVIDRTNGKLLAANAFVPQNWAKGIDLKTGRPIPTELVDRYHKGENVGAVPGAFGGKNWSPMSFNPGHRPCLRQYKLRSDRNEDIGAALESRRAMVRRGNGAAS
jgi:Glucose dehydrogenase